MTLKRHMYPETLLSSHYGWLIKMTAALLQLKHKIKSFPLQNSNQQIWTQSPDCDLFPLNAQRTQHHSSNWISPSQCFSSSMQWKRSVSHWPQHRTQFNTLVELSYFTVCWFMSDQLPHNCKYCHLSVVNQIDHIICQVICLHSRWTLFFCIVLPRELVR